MKLRLALMFEMRPPIADATDVRAFQYVGIGELVMDKGSKSFKSTILGTSTSGTRLGR